MEKKRNLWIIPTDKPSRLWTNNLRRRLELDEFPEQHPNQIAKHIYITNSEEIKMGDYAINSNEYLIKINQFADDELSFIPLTKDVYCNTETWHKIKHYKKIILTTDQELINDGVQAIDDEFLEWFVKNPSCEEVEIFRNWSSVGIFDYGIIIPKEEPKQETLAENRLRKQTSIDWFNEQIINKQNGNGDSRSWDELLQQAKKMERENIESAWHDGNMLGRNGWIQEEYNTGQQYYDKTYDGSSKTMD